MLMRFDPFRDFDRLTQQVIGTGLRGRPRAQNLSPSAPAAIARATEGSPCEPWCTRGEGVHAIPKATMADTSAMAPMQSTDDVIAGIPYVSGSNRNRYAPTLL